MPLKNWCSFTSVALQVRNTGGGFSMLFLQRYTRWQCLMHYIPSTNLCRFNKNDLNADPAWLNSLQLVTMWVNLLVKPGSTKLRYDVSQNKSPNCFPHLMRITDNSHLMGTIWMWILIRREIELVWACTIPLALTAEPLGNISLQQPLQQVFELCSERFWQLHVLQGTKKRQKKGGGQRKDHLKTWQPCHLQTSESFQGLSYNKSK